MKLVDWQYGPVWHLSYNKFRYDYAQDSWWEYLICVGPFQTRWWGKIWPRLIRPPQYSARVKELLLEDLKSL